MRSIMIALVLIIFVMLPVQSQEPDPLTLAEQGPYEVGLMSMTLVDETRQDREVRVMIWYPAIASEDISQTPGGLPDAEADRREAPYPLVLASHGGMLDAADWGEREWMGNPAGHLVSHGFVVVAPDHRDVLGMSTIENRPLDLLFILNQLAAITEGELMGLIDTDHVGVWGQSLGAFTSIAVSGAQIDPPHLADWCSTRETAPLCQEAKIATVPDHIDMDVRWPPISDERIQAIVAVAPGYIPFFGEEGLATATVPSLIIGITQDDIANYADNAVFLYTHLGSENRLLISYMGTSHGSGFLPSFRPYTMHFSTAFFDLYLKDGTGSAEYLTQEYVEQFEDIAWGIYEEH